MVLHVRTCLLVGMLRRPHVLHLLLVVGHRPNFKRLIELGQLIAELGASDPAL